jgi:hypothetical protein
MLNNYSTEMTENQYDEAPEKYPIYEVYQQETRSKYKDIGFAILFIAQLIFVLSFGSYNFTQSTSVFNNISNNNDALFQGESHLGKYIGGTIAMTLGFSYMLLLAIWHSPGNFIYSTNIIIIIANIILSVICFSQQQTYFGFIFILQGLFLSIWFHVARHYIPISKLLLKTAITIVGDNKSILLVPIVSLLFGLVYLIFLTSSALFFVDMYSNNDCSGCIIGVVFCILLFFWMQQIVVNVVHTTVAGVVGTWYYKHDVLDHNITWASLKRSITTSFGSICFGSLVVATIKFMRFMFNVARNSGNNNVVSCCIDCILGCLEHIIEYFNEYAYSYVGIYGTSYIESAKATWALCKNAFFSALFNDNLIYPTLTFAVLFISVSIGFLSWAATTNIVIAIVCALTSYIISSVIMNIIHSAIVALFVCCAESRELLATINPELYGAIHTNQNQEYVVV